MTDRTRWDESPELRQSVKALLINWGWHYSGGMPNIGYYDHQPFTTPPHREKPRPPEYLGQREADEVEETLRREAMRHPEDEPKSLAQLARSLRPSAYRMWLWIEFVRFSGLPDEIKAKATRTSRRTYRRRIDDAMFWYWSAS
jgi:hypothetical protein